MTGSFVLRFTENDLIIKIKKLRGHLCNYSEKMIKTDLSELEENEELENTKNMPRIASMNILPKNKIW